MKPHNKKDPEKHLKGKLNILFVAEYFYPRLAGGEVWSYELCCELAARGHHVSVLTTNHAKLPVRERVKNITILRLSANSPNPSSRLVRLLRLRSFIRKAHAYIREHRSEIDVIHTMSYGVNVPISAIAKQYKIPCITSVHSYFASAWNDITNPASAILMERMERRLLANDSAMMMQVPSAYLKRKIEQDLTKETRKENTKNINVIHNWVGDTFPKAKKLPKDTLLYVGSFERIKIRNIDEFANAAKLLQKKSAKLLLIGKGTLETPLRRALEKRKVQYEIMPSMTHQGTLAYIAGASLVLVPSREESFSLVALESVAQGTPVCGVKVGILPELPGIVAYPPTSNRIPRRITGAKAKNIRAKFSKAYAVTSFEKIYAQLTQQTKQ